ncbi:PAS domain-containing sensor histidine kinase [Kamptonema sp. UHCC 0994]|uniref:PAS domain-containing sensor histidine kinase n=1 Tax=Kamptonema sp. UHCC 0994 TaxID=3031329 RepID=UPI0023BA35DB|nr:PAS domain-containing sensor histidine kinase [Kamptonema sp. UHCC 0994]MDF0551891.1 PAS domain-containing sensor histidine kinase [Kamptonema sp. UHCC 0994]
MNHLLNKLLGPRQMEYLAINQQFTILDKSLGVERFADRPCEVKTGADVRHAFPELIGVEDVLLSVILGRKLNFELKGVARFADNNHPLYFDIYAFENREEGNIENRLIILFEDVTEKMVAKQALLQRANEANLLLSALAASKDYIDKIIKSMGDALLVTTTAGTIKTVNQSAQFLFGYSEAELIGEAISLITGEDKLLCQARHRYILCQGELPKDLELLCRKKTKDKIWVEFSCSAIQTEITGLHDFVYIGRDITERKEEELEIRTALAKEKELREIKSRFFSMIAHEFANPLNTVLISNQILTEYSTETTEAEKLQYLNHINNASKHMVELLNDVRFISSAEAGKLEFKLVPINLTKFCSELVEEIKIAAGRNHIIKFVQTQKSEENSGEDCQQAENLPFLDAKMLRQILNNLLVNAIKYSPQGSTVYFEFQRSLEEAIFIIQDEGIGIPLADREQLFESFYRAHNVGKISGTGLGLAIVRECVNLHEGSIVFSSEVGRGTTFKVAIPLKGNCQIDKSDK